MALWTPEYIDTALWLDAADSSTITESGGLVSAWADKSGNGRDAVQDNASYQPTIDANGYLSFDGASDFLEMNTPVYGSFSVFFVLSTSDIRGSSNWYSSPGILGGEYTGNVADWGVVMSYGRVSCVCSEFGGQRYGTSTWNSGSSFFYGVTRTTGTGALEFWGNGYSDGTNTTSGANITAAPKTRICGHPASSIRLAAEVAEILVLSDVATTEERQTIEGYLAHKWGLTANLPVDHPYKTTAPLAPYSISGTILGADGNPAARTVRAYSRSTGALLQEATSDATTGAYDFGFGTTDEIQRIVLADEGATVYNDIIDRVIPG